MAELLHRVEIYDTTLRDGAQGPGIKFSADDQLRVVQALDELGIAYIEGGQPGSNPKAAELFRRAKDLELKQAKLAAFGSTRHPKSTVEEDINIRALLDAQTEVVTIFAKTSPMHAVEVLGVSLERNLDLVAESVAYLKAQGRRVFLDAEHFFDGYGEDAEYAMTVLERAVGRGLCRRQARRRIAAARGPRARGRPARGGNSQPGVRAASRSGEPEGGADAEAPPQVQIGK